jgi:hypothetical protein
MIRTEKYIFLSAFKGYIHISLAKLFLALFTNHTVCIIFQDQEFLLNMI